VSANRVGPGAALRQAGLKPHEGEAGGCSSLVILPALVGGASMSFHHIYLEVD